MDGRRFDALLQSLADSRRSLIGGTLVAIASVIGAPFADAKKRRKKKKKKCKGGTKKCGKKCIAATSCCRAADCGSGGFCAEGTCLCSGGFTPCQGSCIPDSGCCTSTDCDAGDICAQNQCVTGQGSCAAGADSCAGDPILCGGDTCACYATMDGQTRCSTAEGLSECDVCANDEDCATLFPAVPGVFCARSTTAICVCENTGFCAAPCPV
jgi:hypothetical protein